MGIMRRDLGSSALSLLFELTDFDLLLPYIVGYKVIILANWGITCHACRYSTKYVRHEIQSITRIYLVNGESQLYRLHSLNSGCLDPNRWLYVGIKPPL